MSKRRTIRRLLTVSTISLAAAVPALAQDVTVTGITAGEGYTISVPSVTATASTLTEADIRRLFTGEFSTVAGNLATLDAGEVTIPEITVSYDIPAAEGMPAQQSVVTYKDFRLSDVVDGVAAEAMVGETVIQSGDLLTMTFGPMRAEALDIGALLAFYGMASPSTSDDFKTVYSNFSFEGGSLSSPAGFSCTIGGATLESFEARPLKTDMMAFTQLMMQVESQSAAQTEVSPETIRTIIDFYIDILTAFRSTPTLADGFECSGADPNGQAVAISGGAMEVGGFEPGIYPHFALNDIDVAVEGGPEAGSFSLGNFTWKRMDFAQPIEALKAAATLDQAWFEANWRKLIPALDGLSLADLAIDVPNPEGKGRVAGSLGGFDVTLGAWINGLPSDIDISTDNLVFEVPDVEEGKMLRALGVTSLDLSEDIRLRWNEADQTIVIDALEIDEANLGRVTFSAVLGNAAPELFSENTNVAMAASMGLTVKELTIDLDDRGLTSLIMGVSAAEQGQDPNVMRVGLAGLVQAMVLGIAGTTPEAMAASEQVAAFVKTYPQLRVTFTATSEAGLALPLLMAASDDPSILAGQIGITAEATGEARPADAAITLPEIGMAPSEEVYDGMSVEEAPEEVPAPVAPPVDGNMSEDQQSKSSLKN